MEIVAWLKVNGFQAVQTLTIVITLLYTAYTVRIDEKSRRIENLLSITTSHRKIWSLLHERPELARILSRSEDVERHPVTRDEEMFVHFVFLHASASYQAVREKLFDKPHGLEADLAMFLSLPIPHAVWQRMKVFYQRDFVEFVEACRHLSPPEEEQPFSAH